MGEKEKLLEKWHRVKLKTHEKPLLPVFSEREVWWCEVGENIGVEINGKGHNFVRPVLVYRKLSKRAFLGIPLTTQEHIGSWFVPFRFHEKDNFACINQTRSISSKRMQNRIGKIDESDFRKIRAGFQNLYL